jgi:hypothetical protein
VNGMRILAPFLLKRAKEEGGVEIAIHPHPSLNLSLEQVIATSTHNAREILELHKESEREV